MNAWADGVEVQLQLPVFLSATRVAEGRGVLDVMAVSTLVRNETCTEVPKFPKFILGRFLES